MKKRIAALIAIVILITAVVPNTKSSAAQTVCFTAVNDTLLPLRDATMPAYFGTKLYVPASVFAELGVSSGVSSSQNNLYVYRDGDKLRLNFFISLGLVMDQTGETYENVGLEIIGDVYFVPLDFICEFFGLTYELLMGEPLSVLRIMSEDAVLNRKTFLGHFKRQMEQAYAEYNTPVTTPPIFIPPIPTGSAAPGDVSPTPESYSNVDIYLSFFGINAEYTERILTTLSNYGIKACFFLTGDEIFANAGLVRQISGEGHTVGIMLSGDDQEAYERSSALLFDAAKLIALLAASTEPFSDSMKSFCAANSLIFCAQTLSVSSSDTAATITGSLPAQTGFAELRFECSLNTQRVLPEVLQYLFDFEYNVRTINETYSFI